MGTIPGAYIGITYSPTPLSTSKWNLVGVLFESLRECLLSALGQPLLVSEYLGSVPAEFRDLCRDQSPHAYLNMNTLTSFGQVTNPIYSIAGARRDYLFGSSLYKLLSL